MPWSGEARSGTGYWIWTGRGWLPARSSATFRWSGTAWEPIGSETSPSTWHPPWGLRDTFGLLAWLVVVPTAMVLLLLGVWKVLGLDATQLVIAGSAGYVVWASIGGAIVRPRGRFRDIAIITAIVLLVLIAVPSEWFAAADETKNGGQGQDIGAGFGIALLFAVAFPPTLTLAALGRVGRRRALRRRLLG